MPNETRIAALRGAIYDAALDPSLWTRALGQVADALDARIATLLLRDNARGTVHLLHNQPAGFDAAERAYREHYGRLYPIMPVISLAAPGTVLANYMVTPRRELERTEFFQDWVRPSDVAESVCAAVDRSAGGERSAVFSVLRRNGSAAFEGDDLAAVGQLLPDLKRAIHIQQRLALAEAGAGPLGGAALEALYHVAQAAMIVDREARVRWVNRAGEALLRQDDARVAGICRDRRTGTLRCASPSDTAALVALAHRAVSERTAGEVRLARQPPRSPVVAVAFQAPAGLGTFRDAWLAPLDPGGRALIMLVDPDRAPSDDEQTALRERLRRGYGLTRAEAAVAMLLADGHGLASVAERYGASLPTVRTHAARVFEKTGVRRQAELARIVALLTTVRSD